ncbi:hypothetical protein JKF63_07716 [Porcisia hertigi]|uniref:Transmembrane protein n=1 Tax=Porcisia hertigi TaxID=2761500 RepID=A0A837A972_9TRYP|nr:hypothetical protein JKF63_07716 [Porcisia hertigi]
MLCTPLPRRAHSRKGNAGSVVRVFFDDKRRSPVTLLRRLSRAGSVITAQPGSACVSAETSQRCRCAVTNGSREATRGVTPPSALFTTSPPPSAEDLFSNCFGPKALWLCQGATTTTVDALFHQRFPTLAAQTRAETRHGATAQCGAAKVPATPWSGVWSCPTLRALQPASRTHAIEASSSPVSSSHRHDVLAPPPPPPSSSASSSQFAPPYPPVSNEASQFGCSEHQPPPPAVLRYLQSYRLWASLQPYIQQEQQAVLHLSARAHAAKLSHKEALHQRLLSTMYWTMFIVCPLLGLLFLWLIRDSAAYRAELEMLPYVKYDEALRDFAEAEGHQRRHSPAKGNSGTVKRNTRID